MYCIDNVKNQENEQTDLQLLRMAFKEKKLQFLSFKHSMGVWLQNDVLHLIEDSD